MQSTSWETLGWKKHRLESRLLGENQIPRICRWHHPYGRKWRGIQKPLDESERGEWKVGLKLNIQKTKFMASSPISSVQFSCSVVSDSLRPHELHYARPPCPPPTPGVYPNSCPLSWCCHPTISPPQEPYLIKGSWSSEEPEQGVRRFTKPG